jgi:hypothetical protein
MKQTLRRLAVIVLVLLVAAYAATDLFLGSIVKTGVNRFAPRLTQTKVVLAGAHVSPLTGGGTLSGLVVGNPDGWSDNPALSFGRIHVDLAPFSVFGDHIVVKDIEVDQAEFNYETKVISSNIGDLLKRIEGNAEGNGAGGAPVSKGGQPIKFEVMHFRLHGGRVRLGVGPTALVLPMPPIDLDNLGTAEGGITANQLAFAIMRSVTTGVVGATTQAVGKAGATLGAAAGDGAKKALDGLKGLFGGKN